MRRTKAEVGIQGGEWSYERDGARYEGEVIQLLSNLGATLLGGEPVDGRDGREKLGPAGSPHPLQSSHDKVKFVSKLAVLAGRERGEREREK